MNLTAFIAACFRSWDTNTDAPEMSTLGRMGGDVIYENILWRRSEQFALALSATRDVTPPNVNATDTTLALIRVVGSARLNIVGVDFNGSTATAAKLPIFGTALYPGVGLISTYNVTSLTVESLAAGTLVDVFTAMTCLDADTRLALFA